MGKEISKKSVAVLLVLAIMLSVFLTLAVLQDNFSIGSKSNNKQGSFVPAQTARVTLTVVPPEEGIESGVTTP